VECCRIGELETSKLGLGCATFGRDFGAVRAAAVLDAAMECGVNFLDTADNYPPDDPGRSEMILGQVLGPRRDRFVLATKFGYRPEGEHGRADPRFVRMSLEASLKRLRTDRVDLYQLHRPDPSTPIEETMAELVRLVVQGKIRQIGCSNFSASQLEGARQVLSTEGLPMFSTVQNEYSVLRPDQGAEVLPKCRELGVLLLAYFPLASGLLTGVFRRDRLTPGAGDTGKVSWSDKFSLGRYIEAVEALASYAKSRGHTLLELAIGWVVSQAGVGVVLAGARSPRQMEANAAAAWAWRMTPLEVGEARRMALEALAADVTEI
jgi:aryl-alcohol dehydrogenase-like predicted oxidoreductase